MSTLPAHVGLVENAPTRMLKIASGVAFTEAVKRVQQERGSRRSYARLEEQNGVFAGEITSELSTYIAARDSVYLATSSAAGQPYVQHRGGPPGFIKIIDAQTLAFPDFVGNRQYITTGNLAENDRALLFLMNYGERERIKIWGHARIVVDDPELFGKLALPDNYKARIEQAILFKVTAWDANCPQHIPRLVPGEPVELTFAGLQRRIAYLETTLARAGVAFASGEAST